MISSKNIKGSPKSTAIGVVLIVAVLVGFFVMPSVGATELITGFVVGAGFMGFKDPRKNA